MIAAGAVCEVAGPGGGGGSGREHITSPGKTCSPAERGSSWASGCRGPPAFGRCHLRFHRDGHCGGGDRGWHSLRETGVTHGVGLGPWRPPLLVADQPGPIGTASMRAALAALAAAASAACKLWSDKRGTIAYRVKVAGVFARAANRALNDEAWGQISGRSGRSSGAHDRAERWRKFLERRLATQWQVSCDATINGNPSGSVRQADSLDVRARRAVLTGSRRLRLGGLQRLQREGAGVPRAWCCRRRAQGRSVETIEGWRTATSHPLQQVPRTRPCNAGYAPKVCWWREGAARRNRPEE